MADYVSTSAKLRPLMTRAQRDEMFPKDRWDEHRCGGKFGVQLGYGPNAHSMPDGIGRDHIVEQVSFEAPFPVATRIYGFSVGMSRAEAEEEIARLGLKTMEITHPDVRYLSGKTDAGFEIMLMFRKDGLEKLTLSQPNHSEIMEGRRRFWSERHENEKRQRELANSWKLITDNDDAMLMTWAKHCRPWNDYEPSEFMRFADWLRRADPDQRHAAALIWNWDYGLAPLLWISRREDCDLATALHIFFGCGPESYLKFEGNRALVRENGYDVMTYDMMMDIKGRIERGFYARSSISFDLSKALEVLERCNPTPEQCAALIPANLPSRRAGRRITSENGFGGLEIPAFRIN